MTTLKQKTPPQTLITGFALGIIVISLVVYILNVSATITVPFVMSIFLWYLLNALARGFGKIRAFGHRIPRTWCFALAITCFMIGLWLVFDLIRANAAQVAREAPDYQKHFEVILPRVLTLFGLDHIPTLSEILQHIDLATTLRQLAGLFTGIAGKTFEVLFFTGFLLYEQRFFNRKLVKMIGDHALEEKVRHIIYNIDLKIQRYIWVKTFVSSLAGIATYLILKSIHEDFAGFWGLMAFVLHFIPYVGTFAAIALPSIMALVQFGDVPTFILVAVSLGAALMTIGHILDPRLLGDTMNLSPIFIILSLAMWEMIWGVPGMFLAIPILSIIVIALSQFEATRPLAVLMSKTGTVEKTFRS